MALRNKKIIMWKLYAYTPWAVLTLIGIINLFNPAKLSMLITLAYFVILLIMIGLVKWSEYCLRRAKEEK